MSTEPQNAAQTLSRLQQRLSCSNASEAWLILGDALAELEEVGPHSADGRSWTEVVREVHEKLGYGGLSLGHLQKVRRVRNFVRKVLQSERIPFTDSEIAEAQISALEVAERLYSLDPGRGQAALLACIRDRRKFVDMRREYDAYVEQNPDRLPRKQATWLRKRKSSPSDDAALVEKVILAHPGAFLDGSSAVLRPFQPAKASRFLRATDFGFRIVGPADERTLGVELVSERVLSSGDLTGLLAQTEFQSSFFDRYWIFARVDAAKVEWLSATLDEVRLDRVGLLRLSDDGGRLTREPRLISPSPDRRDLLEISW